MTGFWQRSPEDQWVGTSRVAQAVITTGVALGTWGTLGSAPGMAQTVISGFATTGANMTGMEVTIQYLNGGRETAIWGTTGWTSGGAFGNQWQLIQTGNTYGTPWRFNNFNAPSIYSLSINAVPGNTMFDTVRFQEITPGSADGWTFEVTDGLAPSRFAYSAPIDISLGDLFGTLTLTWDTGFSAGNFLRFIADTDNGTARNPVTVQAPPPPPAPDPVVPDPDPVIPDPDPVVPDPDPVVPDPAPAIPNPDPVAVPEPGVLLGLLMALGLGQRLRPQQG